MTFESRFSGGKYSKRLGAEEEGVEPYLSVALPVIVVAFFGLLFFFPSPSFEAAVGFIGSFSSIKFKN